MLSVKSNNNYKYIREQGNSNRDQAAYWCIVEINNLVFRAKIIHIGRGRYKIIKDSKQGRFEGQVIDASDVLHCET
jgi:hypothetical protein